MDWLKMLIFTLIDFFFHEAMFHIMILWEKNTSIGLFILFLLHSVNFGVKRQVQQYLGLEDTQESARRGKQWKYSTSNSRSLLILWSLSKRKESSSLLTLLKKYMVKTCNLKTWCIHFEYWVAIIPRWMSISLLKKNYRQSLEDSVKINTKVQSHKISDSYFKICDLVFWHRYFWKQVQNAIAQDKGKCRVMTIQLVNELLSSIPLLYIYSLYNILLVF